MKARRAAPKSRGTFTLKVGEKTTAPIKHGASAEDIRRAVANAHHAADIAAEEIPEGRIIPKKRINPHD